MYKEIHKGIKLSEIKMTFIIFHSYTLFNVSTIRIDHTGEEP